MKNEHGATLISVLLLSTVFMILAVSLIRISNNTTKQIEISDNHSQTIALAEMGMSYYQHAVENAYWQVRADIEELIASDQENNRLKEKGYLETAYNLLENSIYSIDRNSDGKPIDIEAPDCSFMIKNVHVTKESDHITVRFSSVGKEKEETFTLSAKMNFTIREKDRDESDDHNTNVVYPNFNEVEKPEGDNVCLNPAQLPTCSSILIYGIGSFSNQLNNISEKTIYATGTPGNLEFKNANGMLNMLIHADGSVETDKNMNNSNHTVIEAKKNAIFHSQLDLTNRSRLLVGNDLVVDGHLSLSDSFVFVEKNATIGKHLTIGSDSKMCVRGDANIEGKVQGDQNRLFIEKENPRTFQENCGTLSTHYQGIDWGDMTPNIEINYEY